MEFIENCQNGDLDKVKELVVNNIDVNTYDIYGITPLSIASKEGHLNIVKYLIKNGANVNATDIFGCTPLIYATNLEIVKYLLENGANIDAATIHGFRPLLIASRDGNINIVKYLVEKGADINAVSNYSQTPISWSSHNGHINIAKYLIQNGADYSSIKDKPVFREILTDETNDIKRELTTAYLSVLKISPYVNIRDGDKILSKSVIPREIILKIVYTSQILSLNDDLPEIRLIALNTFLNNRGLNDNIL